MITADVDYCFCVDSFFNSGLWKNSTIAGGTHSITQDEHLINIGVLLRVRSYEEDGGLTSDPRSQEPRRERLQAAGLTWLTQASLDARRGLFKLNVHKL